MKIEKQLQTDVLIIGGGGAGLRAALAAADAGSDVLVINKGPVAKSGITLTAAGGMQAPLSTADSPETYFRDTTTCGYGLGDENLVQVLAAEACQQVADMERYGVRFVCHDDGQYKLMQFPGQSVARNLFVRGGGLGLVAALASACKRHERITVVDDFFVTGLVKGSGSGRAAIAGAVGVDLRNGELTLIRSKATVMATGGCQWLWEVNDCPADATGDGIIHAYRSGAELVDMEMVLFYPSIAVWPPSLQGALIHYEFLEEAIFDGNIYDKDGLPVLPKPLPVRDQAMRIMAAALREGRGGVHGGLLWYVGDSKKNPEFIASTLNTMQYDYVRSHGVNPATDKIAVAPGAHYLMGGIFIDETCLTSVPGLFATPECAGNFDGANRLAGSGITAIQVFGAKAGVSAHQWASQGEQTAVDQGSLEQEIARVTSRLVAGSSQPSFVAALQKQLRAAVQEYAGVVRWAEGLDELKKIAAGIKQELAAVKVPLTVRYNQQLIDLLQLDNMCEVAALVADSAKLRTESRGHHFRSDFPAADDMWLRHTLAVYDGQREVLGTKPVKRV